MKNHWLKIGGCIVGAGVVVLAAAALWQWPTDWLMTPLVIHESDRRADVIIVLGSGTKKNGNHLPAQAKDRAQMGLILLANGEAPMMIVSGGLDTNTKLVEADMMAQYAVAIGAMADRIIKEEKSHDTYENAVNSLAIMKARAWNTALVVTSPYHTKRACAIFRKQKADVRCIVAPFYLADRATPIERISNFRSVVREYAAWVFGWIRGYV